MITHRVQTKGYKDAQRTYRKFHQHEKGHRNYEYNQLEMKNAISEMKNTLEGIRSRLDKVEN